MPERPPPVLAVMKPGEGVQYDYPGSRWLCGRRGSTCLEETEDVVGLGCVLGGVGSLGDGRCKGCPLTQSAVLYGGCKVGGRVDFFPEIKRGLVPVVGDIIEVELDDGPERVDSVGRVAVCDEPVGVGDDGGGAESGAVALRTTPWASEGGFVDVEFWFAEATGRDVTAWVGDLLYDGLRLYEHVDEGAQTRGGVLTEGVLVDEDLEDERRVANPCVEIVWVGGTRTSDDYAWLVVEMRRG